MLNECVLGDDVADLLDPRLRSELGVAARTFGAEPSWERSFNGLRHAYCTAVGRRSAVGPFPTTA